MTCRCYYNAPVCRPRAADLPCTKTLQSIVETQVALLPFRWLAAWQLRMSGIGRKELDS